MRRLCLIATLMAAAATHAAEPRGIGTLLPDMELVETGGKEWRLSDARAHPVLLVAWAHWCAPCREEMPSLAALNDAWAKPRGARIVLLSIKPENFAKDATLAQQLAPSLAAARTREPLAPAELYAIFGLESLKGARIPKAVLLDGDGQVRFLNDGSRDWAKAGPLLDHWLERALNAPAPR